MIDNSLALPGKAKFFSSLDLKLGYWPVLMGDVALLLSHCHSGLFGFNVVPFGLFNAPAFQELEMR